VERVAILIESTGERLTALLNPDHLEIRRVVGVRRRSSPGGHLSGAGLSDDPLLYTGGGLTQMELKLLFDVTLAGSTVSADSVKDLTAAFWHLSEDQREEFRHNRPPLVRLVWGKHWNVLGIVSAVAERFEHFDTRGAPRRSWLSLRLTRVASEEAGVSAETAPDPATLPDSFLPVTAEEAFGHEVMGLGEEGGGPGCGERLETIAERYYGDPAYWRFLAIFNAIDDPTCLKPGTVLQIPPRRILEDSQ
jgi:hypothetical protein